MFRTYYLPGFRTSNEGHPAHPESKETRNGVNSSPKRENKTTKQVSCNYGFWGVIPFFAVFSLPNPTQEKRIPDSHL
jgi:hypothetical protein